MDYRALLKKYMRNVYDNEGWLFIDDMDSPCWTPAEREVLESLTALIRADAQQETRATEKVHIVRDVSDQGWAGNAVLVVRGLSEYFVVSSIPAVSENTFPETAAFRADSDGTAASYDIVAGGFNWTREMVIAELENGAGNADR